MRGCLLGTVSVPQFKPPPPKKRGVMTQCVARWRRSHDFLKRGIVEASVEAPRSLSLAWSERARRNHKSVAT